MDPCHGSQEEAVVRALLGPPNSKLSTREEWRYGTRGSLVVRPKGGVFFDHETGQGGGWIDLVRRERGGTERDAAAWLETQGIVLPKPERAAKRSMVATYSYRDRYGDLLLEVVRFAPKDFRQRRPDGRGRWIWNIKGVPRVLYRLPEIVSSSPDAIVVVVEGERDADRLASAGLVATTNLGGAGKWRAQDGDALRGRRVVILPDNDEPGRRHADDVLRDLAPKAAQVAILRLDGLAEKGDVSDWLEAGGTVEGLRADAEAALAGQQRKLPARPAAGAAPDTPVPLIDPRPSATAYPVDSLGPLSPVAKAVAGRVQCPVAIAAQSVLAAASLAVQPFADVETLGGDAPVSLFLMTVAASGERKSRCDRLVLQSLRDLETKRMRRYIVDKGRHADQIALHDAERGDILRRAKGATVEKEADLAGLGSLPEPPLSPLVLLADPTLEGLCRQFETGRPSVALFTDEGGQVVGGHAMNRDNRLKSAAGLSRLWDGSALNRTRGSEPAVTYTGRRLSLHIMLQPEVAASVLADRQLRDQGLVSRLLLAAPQSLIGTRLIDQDEVPDPTPCPVVAAFGDRLVVLAEREWPTREGMHQELAPRRLVLDDAARALLVAFYNAVETAQRAGGACAEIRGVASKMSEQAARIAAVMTLFEAVDAERIAEPAMANAINLAGWYLNEARRLLDRPENSPLLDQAEELRRWLIDRWPERHVNLRALVRFGPNRLRRTDLLRSLVAILERNGWLQRNGDPIEIRGDMAREAWRVVRP